MARTITDEEIALIKAMVARGMKKTDIQFFFNRPGRPVNSGRISTIGDGTYSNSAEIAPASDQELNAFLASRSPSTDVALVVAPSGNEASHPLSEAKLRAMFVKDAGGTWRLSSIEFLLSTS